MAFVVASHYRLQIIFFCSHKHVLKIFSLIIKMIGGFVKSVFSKGWLCIRLHFSINICLKFLTSGWYVVTKGNKRSWPFGFCVCLYADCQEAKLTPDRHLSMMFSGYPLASRPNWIGPIEFQTAHFKFFFRRVSSRQSYLLPLMNHILRLVGGRRRTA